VKARVEMEKVSSTSPTSQVLDHEVVSSLQNSILASSVNTSKFQNFLQTPLPKIVTPCGGLNLKANNFTPRPLQHSYEDIVAYGGIPESSAFGTRSSDRLGAQPNADQPQLERSRSWRGSCTLCSNVKFQVRPLNITFIF
jgi:hypothetical protein